MSPSSRLLAVFALAALVACDPVETKDTSAPSFDGLSSATLTGSASVTLSWSAATDDVTRPEELVYEVFSATSSGGQTFTNPVKTTPPGATGIVIEGFAAGVTHFFVVRAKDAAGNSDTNTVEKSVSIAAANTPPVFAGLGTATAQSDTAVTLSWIAATDDSTAAANISYQICYGASATACPGNFVAQLTVTGVTATTVTGLAPGLTYHFVVRARDEQGLADSNNVVRSVTTQADSTPPTFSGATTVNGATFNALTVNWAAASDNVTAANAIVYDICQSTNATTCGTTFTATATSAAGATSHVMSGLTGNTQYHFVVRARDAAGNRDGNTVVRNGTTLSDTQAPTFAGATTVTGATVNSLTVNWAAATDNVTAANQITYLVCRSTASGTCQTSFGATATVTGVTSHTFTGLPANTPQFFVVRARDAANNTDTNTAQVTGQTSADQPPTFAGATNITNITSNSMTVNWAAATDDVTAASALVYDVCASSTNSCTSSFNAMFTSAAGATSYTLTGMSPTTTYNVVVKARDSAGNRSTNTAAISGTTTALPDGTSPTGGMANGATRTGCGSAQITWTQASDNVTPQSGIIYRICESATSGACNTAFTATYTVTGQTSFTATNITSTTAYFVVRAEDAAGNRNTNPAQVSVNMSDSTAPAFGAGATTVLAQCGTTTSGSLSLDWPAATDACAGSGISYEICQEQGNRGAGECTTTWFADFTATTSSLTLSSGLTPATSYTFYVRAKDGYGNLETASSGPFSGTTKLSFAASTIPTTWSSTCSGCHTWSYATTVNAGSSYGGAFKVISPFSQTNSSMYQKVLGTGAAGQQMPPGGSTTTAFQTDLGTWITEGACNN